MTRSARRSIIGVLAVVTVVVAVSGARAQEPLALYEEWRGHTIRGDRWTGGVDSSQEFHKLVEGHTLSLLFRVAGARTDDVGLGVVSNRLAFPAPDAVSAVQATFKVEELEATRCTANPNASIVRPAAISLSKFNDGTGDMGSIGDHIGRVQVVRAADSPDHDGVMRAQGVILRCLIPSCFASEIVAEVDLGPARVHQPVVLRIAWDPANSRFLVGRDDGGDVPLTYPLGADAAPARAPFADIRISIRPANCTAEAVLTHARTRIGDVLTNASAVLP